MPIITQWDICNRQVSIQAEVERFRDLDLGVISTQTELKIIKGLKPLHECVENEEEYTKNGETVDRKMACEGEEIVRGLIPEAT